MRREPSRLAPKVCGFEVTGWHWKKGDITYSPHIETRMVAICRDLTNGARHIAAAKMK